MIRFVRISGQGAGKAGMTFFSGDCSTGQQHDLVIWLLLRNYTKPKF